MTRKERTWDDEDSNPGNHHTPHHNPHHKPHTLEDIFMKIDELVTINQSIKGQLNKAEAEILDNIADLRAKIDELVAAAANADLPQEVVDSLTEVQAAAQALDDVTPDETPVEPV
jgi:hypothetical protein